MSRLAPSFGAWRLDNGKHAWSHLTGLSVTYVAALDRIVELHKMKGDAAEVEMYSQRRQLTLEGLELLFDPTGSYLIRSLDPNGTMHGVLGQDMHNYLDMCAHLQVARLTVTCVSNTCNAGGRITIASLLMWSMILLHRKYGRH